jgi:hypothetical protein
MTIAVRGPLERHDPPIGAPAVPLDARPGLLYAPVPMEHERSWWIGDD